MRIGLIAKALGAQMVLAFFVTQAMAAPCIAPPLTPQAIAQFKLNPEALVAPNSDTRTIESSVRDLAGTDPELAKDLIQLAQGTTPRFRTAIAAGLAQAAIACTNLDQNAALLIQQAVASFEDGQFQASFAAVAGDLSTAATEAAASSAASSVGSVVVVNPNASPGPSTTFGGGGTEALVQITSAAVTINLVNGPTASPSSTTTAANPVSQTR
ncbi:hypothetical protein [Bradyrhizobium sp.]|uniref:hypothetical protein n=1 Tax=Bradyrhizobium sp. TaxID=376 RepID=UPI003C52C641